MTNKRANTFTLGPSKCRVHDSWGFTWGLMDIPAALHRPALERERALAHLGGAAMKKENKGRETEGWSKSMEGRSEGAQK